MNDRNLEVQDLFLEAVGMPEGRRKDWLSRRCNHDPQLRRELQALLNIDASANNLLDRGLDAIEDEQLLAIQDLFQRPDRDDPKNNQELPGTVDIPLRETSDSEESQGDSSARKTIGRYTVLAELGRGGQGRVYRAAHPTLPIEVALKVGWRKVSESEQNALLAEAQALSELEHPGIARVRDLDFDHEGRPILVLELVRGQSLAQILSAAKVTPEQAVKWLVDVADAVDYAHRRGVLHLDLKPENIVIGESNKAKVIDFGLAELRNAWSESSALSRVRGTPAYMAPEQAAGDGAAIGPRSDLFALGAILYQLLVGAPPFHADSTSESIRLARKGEIDFTLLEATQAPSQLIDACRKSLSVSPAERFCQAADFGAAIALSLHSPTIERRSSRRLTTALSAAGGVGIFAVLAFMTMRAGGLLLPWDTRGSASTTPPVAKEIATEDFGEVVRKMFRVTAIRSKDNWRPLEDLAPLRNGDMVRFSIRMRNPAYVRLVWIDAEGSPMELYPRDPDIGHRGDEPVESFESPSDLNGGWPIQGESGIEIALLLVSRSPLDDLRLDELQGTVATASDPAIVGRYFATPSERPAIWVASERKLGTKPEKIDNAAMKLLEKLRLRVDFVAMIVIPHGE